MRTNNRQRRKYVPLAFQMKLIECDFFSFEHLQGGWHYV